MSDTPPDTLLASGDNPPRVDDGNDTGEANKPASKSSPAPRSKARDKGKSDETKRKERRPLVVTIGIAVILLLLIGGLYYWWSTRNLESTDDAYTDGRAVTIAPQVSGVVLSLDVTDNQFVKKDQLLIQIDPRQYITDRDQAAAALATAKAQYAGQQFGAEIARKNFPAQLEQAQAQLANANANLAKTQADYDRQRSLSKLATSQQDIDAATSALKQAQAQVMLAEAQVTQNSPVPQRIGETDQQVGQLKGQVDQAQAKLDQAEVNLSWTVVDRSAGRPDHATQCRQAAHYVAAGSAGLCDRRPRSWVTANFKENQLDRMRPGQPVRIKVDAYPHLNLQGHVDSIQMGSGAGSARFPRRTRPATSSRSCSACR